ncbi:DNA polymerase III subunit alpha [Vagococcus lutrae]|uniref:DNA polymerase III subunit alpha n=1 Tax=Vagococcus lutrae TaxID=81947 RepID=UPI00232BB99A|nr:DNA polymerase III subunit alpha [Vagococcus lutrae]WCG05154.1 DNA polymerase III subunit alpha [Vagococcus lutrae]
MVLASLQTFSAYSLLQSTIEIERYVAQASEKGYQAVALTDINVMHGMLDLKKACEKYEVKPLYGMTLRYPSGDSSSEKFDIVLLAKNQHGYQNLMRLSSNIQLSESVSTVYEYMDYFEEMIVLLPPEGSEISFLVEKGDTKQAQTWLSQLKKKVPSKDIYGGLALYQSRESSEALLSFYHNERLNTVPLPLHRYLLPEHHMAVEVMDSIQNGNTLQWDELEKNGPYYLTEGTIFAQTYEQLFGKYVLDCLKTIVAECNVTLELHQSLLPHFDVPTTDNAASYLRKLCYQFLPERVSGDLAVYEERLEKELTIIHQMGFDDYFLIVWDVMAFTRREKIVTGAGRGSAAGSLVSYVLGITDVDPIQYGLLFERFLNPERHTMPDIDLDIPDNRRDEVLAYVYQRYGANHVAQIATFGTMAAKMVLRDVARVFGLSQNEANQWANAVPNTLKITLDEAYTQSKELRELVATSGRNQQLYEIARVLEGLPRHVSTHAAGVVISDKSLTKFVPLMAGSQEIPLTQFTMHDVEAVGLLKMDFLGLRNLSILDETMQHIRYHYRQEINHHEIPMNDPKTLALFQKGETVGVFQFESNGIRHVLRQVQPTSIEDIAAVNALYRPGPMENIDLFVKRKHGLLPIEYPDDSLKDILDVTYGVMIYQEQVMQVASKMAGFSLGQADILQRAISKKIKHTMLEQRQAFITGATRQGYSSQTAETVYQYIEKFANYGFNRSHAMAYSFVGYQMAYFKVHYPACFYVSLLSSVRNNNQKVILYIQDARKAGVKVVGPDINESFARFTLKKNTIRFGFGSLKGIRRDFIQNIVEERRAHGPFTSLDNFLLRIDNKWLKEDYILPLIQVGAFDKLHQNRRQLVVDLESHLKNILISGGSLDLLEMMTLKKERVADYDLSEKLAQEEALVGVYLSGHPVKEYRVLKMMQQCVSISDVEIGKPVRLLGYIKQVRQIKTKKGEFMAFVTVSDETGEISLTVFPQLYRKERKSLEENRVILVQGKVEESRYNQEKQVLASEIQLATAFDEKIGKQICYLKIEKGHNEKEDLAAIKAIAKKHSGITPIIIYVEQSDQKFVLSDEFWVSDTQVTKKELSYILGETNVVFR